MTSRLNRLAIITAAVVLLQTSMMGSVEAACTPAAANNVSATCSGVTPGGYGSLAVTNLNVTVESGASVAGGILFNTGSLTNWGTTSGFAATSFFAGTVINEGILTGNTGIDAASAVVTNRGSIIATGIGITTAGGPLTLDNYGLISGLLGVVTDQGIITNAGTIIGSVATGIDASVSLTFSNSGTVSGQTAAVTAPTADITNTGLISSVTTDAIDVASLTMTNTGRVRGVTSGVHGATADITNSGSIFANVGSAINLSGNLILNNSGLVSGAIGAQASTATIVNSGFIVGTSNSFFAGALRFSGAADVTNSGTIRGGSYGIFSSSDVRLSNSGTVFGGFSAVAVNGAIINNTGSILSNSVAVDAAFATINNSGTISGRAIAIAANKLDLFNTGTISAVLAGASVIYSSDASIANAGTIAAADASGFAMDFLNAADRLTLLPGSKIIGRIELGGGANTIDFRGGNHNLTFTSLSGTTVTSSTPYVVSGARAVAIDPTPFAVADRNLLSFISAVSSALPVVETPSSAAKPAMSYAATGKPAAASEAFAAVIAPEGPTALYAGGASVWARGFAGQRDQSADGALLRSVYRFGGGFIGGDWQANPVLRFGGFVGGGSARSTVDLGYGNTGSEIVFGGAFARATVGVTFLDLVIQAGHMTGSTSRQINNNLVASGLETAQANHGGFYASPELGVGRNVALGEFAGMSFVLTPAGRIRYLGASLGGYSESGSTANLTVNARSIHDLEERAELKLSATIAGASLFTASLRAGVLGTQRLGETAVNATLLGQFIPFSTPGAAALWGGFGGGSLVWRIGPVSVFVAGDYLQLSDTSTVFGGRGGLRVSF